MNLWNFSIETYGEEGISTDCLTLQDTMNVDVPILLWAVWAEMTGHVVDASALAEAELGVSIWRDEVVKPLRAVRRWLKHGPPPTPFPATEALRDGVKAAELSAEKIELETLAALPLRKGKPGPEAPLPALRLIASYFAKRDCTDAENAALGRIAVAARRVQSAPR